MKSYVTPNDTDIIGISDSESIQNAVNLAHELGAKVVIPRKNFRTGKGEWSITETILLPSDITIILDNCYIRQADGSFCNVFRNKNAGIIGKDAVDSEQKNIKIIDMIEKENSSLVSQYDLYANIPEFNNSGSFEMYLSKDGNTISILAKYVWTKNTNITTVVNLDISNILDIKYSNKIEISGTYVASRYINEELLIITNVNPMINQLDFDDISTFIPSYTYGGQTIYIDGDKIEIADNASNYHYSVLTKVNQKTQIFSVFKIQMCT